MNDVQVKYAPKFLIQIEETPIYQQILCKK